MDYAIQDAMDKYVAAGTGDTQLLELLMGTIDGVVYEACGEGLDLTEMLAQARARVR